jgi:hypothetical protein
VTQAADSFSFPYAQTIFTSVLKIANQTIDGSNAQDLLRDVNPGLLLGNGQQVTWYNGSAYAVNTIMGAYSQPNKMAVTGNAGTVSISANGQTAATAALPITTAATVAFYLGSYQATGNFAYGDFMQVGFWNGIGNANVQQLSTLP